MPKSAPRLVFVSQPVSGGVAACVADQALHAINEGYSVTIVCPPIDRGPLGEIIAADRNHISLDMKRSPGWRDFVHWIRLRKVFQNADVVHLHSSKAGALGRLAARSMPRRDRPAVVFTPHAWSWFVGGWQGRLYKFVEKRLAPWAMTIAVSEGEAEEGRKILGERADLIVINNGVDLARFSPYGKKAKRGPEMLVVCVGRLAHQKGQDLALRALAESRSVDSRLRIVGSGSTKPSLVDLAQQLGISDRIEWVDETEDPASHLRAADVVLIPSRWDGQSLVLLESMAVGAAIVATEVAGAEVARDVSLIVGVGDTNGIALAVDKLLENASLRDELSSKAQQHSLKYDIHRTLTATAAVWDSSLTESADSH